jgi:hypothetical protein
MIDILPPTIEVVSPDHALLEGVRLGRAVVYESGRSVVYISSEMDPESDTFRIVVDHELSHIDAWQKHGTGIEEHGPKWRSACMARNSDACVTDMIRPRKE